MRFQNLTDSKLSPDDVCRRVLRFMAQDPQASYHFMIGTDSQVHRGYTKFVTGLIIHRLGKGAWACYRTVIVPREIESVKEKLSMETALSQEVASIFSGDIIRRMEDLLLPHILQGASLTLYIDIDAGTEPKVNVTAKYVQEMVDRVEAMGKYAPRVKPHACAASAYANRHTKRPARMALG
ncbi:ribonuclease H-like YkuK family protein [Paenibacillus chartarius]|uniref:Ribonuclease H-like YkuK family protein n=1 Tax=Paenibacillus chartarius TaxID=747481 RepID=A0ABV6DN00_9BACL